MATFVIFFVLTLATGLYMAKYNKWETIWSAWNGESKYKSTLSSNLGKNILPNNPVFHLLGAFDVLLNTTFFLLLFIVLSNLLKIENSIAFSVYMGICSYFSFILGIATTIPYHKALGPFTEMWITFKSFTDKGVVVKKDGLFTVEKFVEIPRMVVEEFDGDEEKFKATFRKTRSQMKSYFWTLIFSTFVTFFSSISSFFLFKTVLKIFQSWNMFSITGGWFHDLAATPEKSASNLLSMLLLIAIICIVGRFFAMWSKEVDEERIIEANNASNSASTPSLMGTTF